jgi:hypothetical protein
VNGLESTGVRPINNEPLRRPLIAAAVLFAIVLSLGGSIWFWLKRPPLHVTQQQATVKINVQTLGEYSTTIRRLRLSEATSGRVIWEIRAIGIAQARSFTLHAGENHAGVTADFGKFEIVAPSSPMFVLHDGVTYKVELWGDSPSSLYKRSAVFELGI